MAHRFHRERLSQNQTRQGLWFPGQYKLQFVFMHLHHMTLANLCMRQALYDATHPYECVTVFCKVFRCSMWYPRSCWQSTSTPNEPKKARYVCIHVVSMYVWYVCMYLCLYVSIYIHVRRTIKCSVGIFARAVGPPEFTRGFDYNPATALSQDGSHADESVPVMAHAR